LRTIVFKDRDGIFHHAQIGQDRVNYSELVSSLKGDNKAKKVFIVVKQMPDSFTLNQAKKALSEFTWASRGFTHPFLASVGNVTWLWHKSGVRRRMFIAEVFPHELDPLCNELPSKFSPKPGRIAPFIIGCSPHTCKLCKQLGHREEIHDSFRGRASGKRTRQESASDAPDAKMSKFDFMQAIEGDRYIELVSADNSKKSWKCTLCSIASKGFFRCWRHITSDGHKDGLAGATESNGGTANTEKVA
jgi:hypothetical protein